MIQSTKQINKFDIYARERRYGNKVLANVNIKMLKQNRIIEFQFDIEIRAVHNTEMEWMRCGIFINPTPVRRLKNRKINNKQNKYTGRFASVKVKRKCIRVNAVSCNKP